MKKAARSSLWMFCRTLQGVAKGWQATDHSKTNGSDSLAEQY
jgi:hypothetical protein